MLHIFQNYFPTVLREEENIGIPFNLVPYVQTLNIS